jgi:hypothetical protein
MGAMTSVQRYAAAMLAERVGLGVAAIAAPGPLLAVFGAPEGSDGPVMRYFARIFGIRNIALGLQVWDARDDVERLRQLALLNAAVELSDAVAGAVTAARSPEMRRAGAAAVATSLAVASGFVGLSVVAGRHRT